jgi:hypothetical protein
LVEDKYTDSVQPMVICGVWSLRSRRNATRFGRDRWIPNATVSHVSCGINAKGSGLLKNVRVASFSVLPG